MKKIPVAAAFIAVVIAAAGYMSLMKDYRHEKETIFYNGRILTMDKSRPSAGAVLVRDGIIAAVGSTEEVMKLKSPDTVMFDLRGRVMMPGFIDPHTHPDIAAFLHDMVDLSGFTHGTNRQVWEHLGKAVAGYSPGQWIVCKGLDPILTADLETPRMAYLDRIAPDNPLVIISQSMHSYWANSRAFDEAGISKDTPDPSASSFYEKDSSGHFTGFIAEQEAFLPFRNALMKTIPLKKLSRTAEKVMREYAENGNTTIVTAGLTTKDVKALRLYEHMSAGKPSLFNQLLALFGLFPARSPLPRHFLYIRFDALNMLPDSPDNGDDFYRILGVKHWYDGSPYTGSMYMKQPYLNSGLARKELHIQPGQRGKSLISRNELTEFIRKYNGEKWQISVHTQGDSAIEETLAAFEEVSRGADIVPYRHRIEHCILLDRHMLEKMKTMNITPSIHINHLYYYGKALKESILGGERAERMLPLRSITDAGSYYTLHADAPMFESRPLSLIHTAVNRKTREGTVLGAGEAVTVQEALEAMTIMAAWQIGLENRIGSIREGKYADLVILDRDPLEVPKEKIRDIRVVKTIVGGNGVEYPSAPQGL